MKLVRATNQSRLRNLRIKELGRLAREGETFTVSDERYEFLAKGNRFRVPFVTLVQDLEPEPAPKTVKVESKPKKVKEEPKEEPKAPETVEIIPEEKPEIFVIEPGKEPVKVDENLEPIKEEEPVVEEAPKKKRGRKKKEEVVAGEK